MFPLLATWLLVIVAHNMTVMLQWCAQQFAVPTRLKFSWVIFFSALEQWLNLLAKWAPEQNSCHFSDVWFKSILLKEIIWSKDLSVWNSVQAHWSVSELNRNVVYVIKFVSLPKQDVVKMTISCAASVMRDLTNPGCNRLVWFWSNISMLWYMLTQLPMGDGDII